MTEKTGTPYFAASAKTKKNLWTLVEILLDIKEIIKTKRMFDPNNPAIILCDQEMEKVLNMKAIHVSQIRSVIQQHLELVEVNTIRPANVPLPKGYKEMKDTTHMTDVISNPVRRNPVRSVRLKLNEKKTPLKAPPTKRISPPVSNGTPLKIRKVYKKKACCELCKKMVTWTVVAEHE